MPSALAAGQPKRAKELAIWYKKTFPGRYYLELQDHEHHSSEQKAVNDQLIMLGHELGIPLVVTADAHYCSAKDQDAHEVLLCVQTASQLADEKRMSLKDFDLHVSSQAEIAARWQRLPEALANTQVIADSCDVKIEFGKILIPKFVTPNGQSAADHLRELATKGVAWRYGQQPKAKAAKLTVAAAAKTVDRAIIERLEYELSVITQMNLADYFLIVADFINWAKGQGIIVGPGRGSAAGSVVSYALNITDLDPLKYELLFERFLNPDRIAMPDIDMDFQDDRRDEVIEYVRAKYGDDRVANIVTFGRMAARNAIRDTARVLGKPYAEADRLAKMVPPPVQGFHTPLAKHIRDNPELKAEYAGSASAKEIIDLAIRLEGTIRSHGVHAAGVIIAPDELVKFTPLELAQKGVVATQYSMNPVDDLGLLKMDFLGLSNLTIINNALRIIKKVHKKSIDLATLPLDDRKTFELLSHGDTTGVFQFESAGMKRYIKDLKPNRFEDLIAMGALYRPGPMQWIGDYIDRKHGRKEIKYLHPTMRAALEQTYGILVYQEQVMQISKEMCGFTGGQADTLRKAIGKKKPEVMAAMKKDFIEGAIKTSKVDRKVVEDFWASLEAFAAYCFPKAHAACYATISYWTAYLKAYYPAEFMAALLTSDFEDTDRIAIELEECRRMGIEVLPPDVNESFVEFGTVPGKNAIRFALAAIKNVGKGAAEAITDEREQNGAFKSVEDFARRISLQQVNRKTYESLVKAGAFDGVGERLQLLASLDGIVAFAGKVQKQAAIGQFDLFGASENLGTLHLELSTGDNEISDREKLQWERQLLGVYLSQHPLEVYKQYLADNTQAIGALSTNMEGREVQVAGFITAARKIVTRNGSMMAFVTIEDLSGSVEVIVFPKLFETTADLWEVDRVVEIEGRLTSKDRDGRAEEELKIMAEKAHELDHDRAAAYQSQVKPSIEDAKATAQPMVVQLPDSKDVKRLTQMKEILRQFPGQTEVWLELGESATKIRLPFKVAPNQRLSAALAELVPKA